MRASAHGTARSHISGAPPETRKLDTSCRQSRGEAASRCVSYIHTSPRTLGDFSGSAKADESFSSFRACAYRIPTGERISRDSSPRGYTIRTYVRTSMGIRNFYTPTGANTRVYNQKGVTPTVQHGTYAVLIPSRRKECTFIIYIHTYIYDKLKAGRRMEESPRLCSSPGSSRSAASSAAEVRSARRGWFGPRSGAGVATKRESGGGNRLRGYERG